MPSGRCSAGGFAWALAALVGFAAALLQLAYHYLSSHRVRRFLAG